MDFSPNCRRSEPKILTLLLWLGNWQSTCRKAPKRCGHWPVPGLRSSRFGAPGLRSSRCCVTPLDVGKISLSKFFLGRGALPQREKP